MSNRDIQEPTLAADPGPHASTRESHPAFGILSASRVSQGGGGAVLFDSEVQHQHYITVKIETAERDRHLNRDWIHGRKQIIEVAISESQWGRFVSSLNSGGTPCTIEFFNDRSPVQVDDHGRVPGLPFAPRMEHQHRETVDAAVRTFEKIEEAYQAFIEHPNAANKRALGIAIEHTRPGIDFAVKSLTEFTETTVASAKADIEAMMESKIRTLGLEVAAQRGIIELESGVEA